MIQGAPREKIGVIMQIITSHLENRLIVVSFFSTSVVFSLSLNTDTECLSCSWDLICCCMVD